MTELEQLKEDIEDGDSCIEAYEQVDLTKMCNEGNAEIAGYILEVLRLVGVINDAAKIGEDA